MKSLKLNFNRLSYGQTGFSPFWLLVILIILLNDDDRRKNKERKKRQLQAQSTPKPPSGPIPF